jgi:hypothetical protein
MLNANVVETDFEYLDSVVDEEEELSCYATPNGPLLNFKNLQFKEMDSDHYQISWENCEQNPEIVYHIFASNTWQDLMPLSYANQFIHSFSAGLHLLISTRTNSIEVPKYTHFRIVAEYQNTFIDLTRLTSLTDTVQLEDESRVELFKQSSKNSSYAPPISEDIWQQVTPYLIPSNHYAKAVLDKIFWDSKFRVLASENAMKKAGFIIKHYRKGKGLIIASHPLLKKYLVKVYLDTAPRSEWGFWVLRARGANFLRSLIDKNGFNHLMKVPFKWIYPVPRNPKQSIQGKFPKNFILVVQDMERIRNKESQNKYKYEITHEQLDALHHIILEGGLNDSHIGNIPFSVDGKIAFIDTEFTKNWPVHFEWLTPFFSFPMQEYWRGLNAKTAELNKPKPS